MLLRLMLFPVVLMALVILLAWLVHRPLPPRSQEIATSSIVDTAHTRLGRALAAEKAQHPELSGIYPLSDGRDAFVARTVLADMAEHSIDIQYYIWRNDTAGRLLWQRLIRAANRGVHVRLLLDDINTSGIDPLLMTLDSHTHIEVRLFNPLMHRNVRLLNYLNDFARTNRRMHNKSFTVDRQFTVMGGRNIGDEYFDAGEGVMFADLDVLAAGDVVSDVSADFDRYWNSASTYPLQSIVASDIARSPIGTEPASDPATQNYLKALMQSDLTHRLHTGNLKLEWATAHLVSDDPAKGLGQALPSQMLLGRLRQVMDQTRKELIIVSPYFIPTQKGTDVFTALAQRGISVTVLTNSLAATDVAVVHAGYVKYRKDLLRAGVRLRELKPSATVQTRDHDGLAGSSGASLHAKTFAIDRGQLFVGSFNMDPRSATLNTEMGLLIDSPVLASQLPAALAAHGMTNSYAVTLEGNALRWSTEEDGRSLTFEQEPNTSWLRRASVRVLSWLPIEWML